MAQPACKSDAAVSASPEPPVRAGEVSVSIIVCTKHRPRELAAAIRSIRDSGEAGRRAEIVVVEEAAAPREIPGVRYVHLPPRERGFGYARNAGVAAARGDLLLFIDDDCEAAPGWAERLLEPLLANQDVLGVAGAVLVRDCGAIGYAENILGFPGGGLRYRHAARGRVVPTRYLSTCNCAYRRRAVQQAGGFPEDARMGGEDFLLAERVSARGRCVYAPDAVVYHAPRGTFAGIYRWFVRRGQSEIDLMRLSRERRRRAGFLLRSSWTLRAILLAVLLLRWPWLAPAVPPAALGYAAFILFRFRFALRYPAYRPGWLVVPLVKLTMDWGSEMGRLKGLFSPKGA